MLCSCGLDRQQCLATVVRLRCSSGLYIYEEVLLRVNEQRNILHEIRKRKANWIGHILCRNCLLQQVIEGKIKGQIEVTRRRGRRRKKLLDYLKDRRGYCQLKEEALDCTMWRNRFGRGLGLSFDRLLMMMMMKMIGYMFRPVNRSSSDHQSNKSKVLLR